MYINNNKSVLFRTFHKTFCVLSASTVLFSLSACGRADIAGETVSAPLAVQSEDITIEYVETTSETESTTVENTEMTSETEYTTVESTEMTSTAESTETASETEYVPTPAELNAAARARIYETYGVNILYGSDVTWSYGTSGAGITSDELIASRLALLEDCLSEYPAVLFSDLREYSPITINLIDSLGGADGYTDASDSKSIQIALSCGNSELYFTLAFHHELFHFIEYCIMNNFDNADELINTDEFTDTSLYGTDGYSGTIYDTDADIYSQYFTSIYGKTNRLEDRAELFSYYMGYTIKECMKYPDTPISLKMRKLADAIRICCPSLNEYEEGTLPWEEKLTYK